MAHQVVRKLATAFGGTTVASKRVPLLPPDDVARLIQRYFGLPGKATQRQKPQQQCTLLWVSKSQPQPQPVAHLYEK